MKNIKRFILVSAVTVINIPAIASAMSEDHPSVTSEFSFQKASCTNSELALLAGLALQYRNAGENELRAIRAESINKHPELKEQILSSIIRIPRKELIIDALESDSLQYPVTCKSPMLTKSLSAMESSARAENLRITRILKKAESNVR